MRHSAAPKIAPVPTRHVSSPDASRAADLTGSISIHRSTSPAWSESKTRNPSGSISPNASGAVRIHRASVPTTMRSPRGRCPRPSYGSSHATPALNPVKPAPGSSSPRGFRWHCRVTLTCGLSTGSSPSLDSCPSAERVTMRCGRPARRRLIPRSALRQRRRSPRRLPRCTMQPRCRCDFITLARPRPACTTLPAGRLRA